MDAAAIFQGRMSQVAKTPPGAAPDATDPLRAAADDLAEVTAGGHREPLRM
jgi:hypothetical protein